MYVKRDLEKQVRKYMGNEEILAIVGARQCSKTTLVHNILKDYRNVNEISFDDLEINIC